MEHEQGILGTKGKELIALELTRSDPKRFIEEFQEQYGLPGVKRHKGTSSKDGQGQGNVHGGPDSKESVVDAANPLDATMARITAMLPLFDIHHYLRTDLHDGLMDILKEAIVEQLASSGKDR